MTQNTEDSLFQIKTVWHDGGRIFLLDQTLLPAQETVVEMATVEAMWDAIKRLCVRGAPAIGVAAGYGVWVAARNAVQAGHSPAKAANAACEYLATSRPTAVNLFWALDRMRHFISDHKLLPDSKLSDAILAEAEAIRSEDLEACKAIGRHGADLISDGDNLLTHCNAGALATSGFGTALAPIFWAAHMQGKHISVYADETRPLLQGARLTAWELTKANIPVTLICDSAAAAVLAQGRVQKIIVGADRIAANGDVANKIGTYGLAVLARHHGVPFYVAAPWSTVDLATPSGSSIIIEERGADEVACFASTRTAPVSTNVYNPAFDITPAALVSGYITEKGVFITIDEVKRQHTAG